MRELWIPELVIALFYLLFLLRIPVRRFHSQDGLIWLPPIALALSVGIFPAYGFRFEALPLLLYGGALNFANLPALRIFFRRRKNLDLFDHDSFFFLIYTVLLAVVVIPALWFAPASTGDPVPADKTLTVKNGNREYFLRVYGAGEGRPLLLLVPPSIGPVPERLCGELARQGFTALTYSRRGFDAPAVKENGQTYPVSPGELYRRLRLPGAGTRLKKANDTGRALEEGRREDVEFLLSYLPSLGREGDFLAGGQGPLFLAGCGAGGSALILLAGSPGFARRYPEVRGIAALESYLWSAWREEPEGEDPPAGSSPRFGFISRAWKGISARFRVKKMAGTEQVPPPEVPLLILLSDRSRDPKYRDLYGGILGAGTRGTALTIAAAGAGPLDFTGIPDKYPLFPALFPGRERPRWNGGNFTQGAAAIIGSFAALILGQEDGPETARPGPSPALSPDPIPPEGLYTERRAWNLPNPGYILIP